MYQSADDCRRYMICINCGGVPDRMLKCDPYGSLPKVQCSFESQIVRDNLWRTHSGVLCLCLNFVLLWIFVARVLLRHMFWSPESSPCLVVCINSPCLRHAALPHLSLSRTGVFTAASWASLFSASLSVWLTVRKVAFGCLFARNCNRHFRRK